MARGKTGAKYRKRRAARQEAERQRKREARTHTCFWCNFCSRHLELMPDGKHYICRKCKEKGEAKVTAAMHRYKPRSLAQGRTVKRG